jgi:hypothetical protein
MKHFALFISIGSVILLIVSLFMIYYNWSHDLSIWSSVLLSIATSATAYSSYISYKKYK